MSHLDKAASQLEKGTERAAGDTLEHAIDELVLLRAQVKAAVRRRPWVAAWRALDDAVAAVAEVVDVYLGLLVADTPIGAQRSQPRLQGGLDRCAAVMGELSSKIDRFAGISAPSASSDDLVSLAAAAFSASGASNLTDFDQRGSTLAARITGSAAIPVGFGPLFAMKSVAVEAILDEDRYYRIAKEVYTRLIADPDKLRSLCLSPRWLDDNVAAGIEARDIAVTAQALAQAAWNERLEARTVITVGHSLVEGPGGHYMATILSVTGRHPYDQLRVDDAGKLVKSCRQAGFATWIEGLDDGIRNAHAHSDWALTDKGIELRPGTARSRCLPAEDLLDLVMQGVESILAIDAAVVLAASYVGVDFSSVDWRKALCLNDQSAVRLMLAMAGWADVVVHSDHGTVTAAGSTGDAGLSVAVLGAVTATLGPDAVRVQLSATLPDGTVQVLEGPVALLRAMHSACEGTATQIALAEVLRTFHLDGEPIADRRHIRRWGTSVAIEALQSPLKEAIRELRGLRTLAERTGDEQLAEAATGTMTLVRGMAGGGNASDVLNSATFRRIEEWAKMDVAPLRLT